MKKVLKIYIGYYINASRDARELLAAQEAGFDIEILCFGKQEQFCNKFKNKLFEEIDQNGIKIKRFYIKNFDVSTSGAVDWRWDTWIYWIKYLKKQKPDVISGHNIEALLIGYLFNLTQMPRKKAKLVYDAHEYLLGENLTGKERKKQLLMMLEKFLMKRCDFSIMVNTSIANRVRRMYKLEKRPLVIRSTPPCWKLDDYIIAKRRKEIEETLKVNQECFIIMYHGGIMENRGIETLVDIVERDKKLRLVIMGYALQEIIKERIERLITKKGVSDRILFLPPVNVNQIWEYAGAADCGIHILPNSEPNNYLCLPNKIFENIQSLTPLITSNFPEMKRIIEKYKIGITCDPSSSNEILDAIRIMRDDRDIYAEFKKNLIIAKASLCWEKEKRKLIRAYRQLL